MNKIILNNRKSLLKWIFKTMKALDKKEINYQEAQTQAALARQANNIYNYDIQKASLLLKLKDSGIELNEINVED